jgi:fimbrial chaperone protein
MNVRSAAFATTRLALLLCFALGSIRSGLVAAPDGSATTGGVDFSPMIVEMNAREPVGSITVTNHGSDERLFAVRAFDWSENDGEEKLTANDGVIVVPPVLQLGPGESRIIRIGLRHPPEGARERAYRLVVSEVPPTVRAKNAIAVVMAMKMPIFVRTDDDDSLPTLAWATHRSRANMLTFAARNDGNVHAKILSLHVFADIGRKLEIGRADPAAYVLPGEARSFDVPLARPPTATAVAVEAVLASGRTLYATIPLR